MSESTLVTYKRRLDVDLDIRVRGIVEQIHGSIDKKGSTIGLLYK